MIPTSLNCVFHFVYDSVKWAPNNFDYACPSTNQLLRLCHVDFYEYRDIGRIFHVKYRKYLAIREKYAFQFNIFPSRRSRSSTLNFAAHDTRTNETASLKSSRSYSEYRVDFDSCCFCFNFCNQKKLISYLSDTIRANENRICHCSSPPRRIVWGS